MTTLSKEFLTTTNEIGFKVVSDDLHKQLFPSRQRAELTAQGERRVRQHYAQFGSELPPAMPEVAEHSWRLPKLQGSDLRAHFEAMAKEFAEDYDQRARALINCQLPPMPSASSVKLQPGWTKYSSSGIEQVEAPLEHCYVLDCETLVQKGAFPIIATAVSTEAWYVWLDPALCDLSLDYEPRLYPIGDDKLVIGHNVTYDWQRCIESHWLEVPKGKKRSYSLCTMGMHIVTNGYSGPQRWVTRTKDIPGYAQRWANVGCSNSLLNCYNFHTWPETPLTEQDKELRELFVTQDLPAIRHRFVELIEYALLDVQYTWELFVALYPKYRQKRPSWTSLAGVLQQSAHNLPVVDNWFDWIQTCETKLAEYELAIDEAGRSIAKELNDKLQSWVSAKVEQGLPMAEVWKLHNAWLSELKAKSSSSFDSEWLELMSDSWLGSAELDWSIRPKVKSGRGLPEWYRGLGSIGRSSRQLHQLVRMSYQGKPLLWRGQKLKWAYQGEDGKWQSLIKPSKDETAQTVLCNDFKDWFRDGTLSVSAEVSHVLDLCMAVTYWTSCRGRAKEQIVHRAKLGTGEVNVVTPDLVPTGTVSGRGVSPLWLTVTDVKYYNKSRIGVELKSRIQAPQGYCLVQADFSAQELRIGAAYADSIGAREHLQDSQQLGYIGSSLMSHGVYAGNKELGTDPHTMLAKSVGIDRGGAKTAGYAMLYGAGRKTIGAAIMQHYAYENPNGDRAKMQLKALSKADEALAYKKGKAAKGSSVYLGGTDSACYTVLASLASAQYPKTPLLRNQLTAPLCPANCGNDFATGRTNWGIQATARDQADCLTVAFDWLCKKHQVNARAIFLYHDELLVFCSEQDKELAAWLLNVAHCWTWAFTNEAMEIYDMCAVGTWFDDVMIQQAFRKSADLDCRTPSNPDEIIPDGQVLLEWAMPALNDKAVARGLKLCPELYS